MRKSGQFRISYKVEIQKVLADLKRVEQALRVHAQRVGVGAVVGGDPRVVQANERAMAAMTHQMRAMRTGAGTLSDSTRRLTGVQNQNTRSVVMGTSAYRNFGVALRRVALWAGAGAVIYGLARLTRTMAATATEFQYFRKELVAIGTEGEMVYSQLAVEAIKAAYETGRAWEEAADITKAWVRQGRSALETAELLRTTLIGMNLTNMGAVETVRTLTAQLKAFDVAATDSIVLIDRLYGVSRRHAIEPAQVATGLLRFSAAAKEVGVDIDEAYGLMVGILAKTQQSAQMTGTALRTILTRIYKPAAVDILQTTAKIPVYMDAAGESFRSAFDILNDLASVWDRLTGVERVHIAQTIAGVRRVDQFSAAMQNWSEVLGATIDSMASAGDAIRAQQILMDTQAKAAARLRTAFDELLATRGGFLDFIMSVTKGLTAMLNMFQRLSKVVPDATTRIMEVLALGVGLLLGGPVGLGVAGGLVVGLEALSLVGETARKSLQELRAEYNQFATMQFSQAQSTWRLADRYMALAGETDGLTKHQEELSKIQRELITQLPDLVSSNQSLAETYSVLSANISTLGERYVAAREKLLRFQISSTKLEIQRARMEAADLGYDLPVHIGVTKGLGGRLKQLGMQVAGMIKAGVIDLKRYETTGYEKFDAFLETLRRQDKYTLTGAIEEAERRFLQASGQMAELLEKGAALTDEEQKRVDFLRDETTFWDVVLQRVLKLKIAHESIVAMQERQNLLAEELASLTAPEPTKPKGTGFMVETWEAQIRALKGELVEVSRLIDESGDRAKVFSDRAAEGSEWSKKTAEWWDRSGQSAADIVEYTQQAERTVRMQSQLMAEGNRETDKTAGLYERISPVVSEIEAKLKAATAEFGESDERVQALNSLLSQALNIQRDIDGVQRDWQRVVEAAGDAWRGNLDVLTMIRAQIYANAHLGEVLRHNMELAAVEGGEFAASMVEIKALLKAMADLDQESIIYLKLRNLLLAALNRRQEDFLNFEKRAGEERARTVLQNEVQMLELMRGRISALERELTYWEAIERNSQDIVEQEKARNELLRIRGAMQLEEARRNQQILADLFRLGEQAVSGDMGVGGWVRNISTMVGAYMPGPTGIAIAGGGNILAALIDKLGDNEQSVDENTLALNRNTEAIWESQIAVPSYFSMPPALVYGGRLPYLQEGGYVARTGTAVVHEGESVGRQLQIGEMHFNVYGGDAKAVAREVRDILVDEFELDSRRGVVVNSYGPS